MRVIAGSEVFASAFNIDRNFLRSGTNWKQRRPDKHLLQYRTEVSPSSCVRCRLLVPFTILSVSLVCYYYFFFISMLWSTCWTFPVWRTKVKLEPRADWPVTEAETARRLCCSSGVETSQITVNVQMIWKVFARQVLGRHLPRLAFK